MNKFFTKCLTGLVTVQMVSSGLQAYGNTHFVPVTASTANIPGERSLKPIKGKIIDEKGLALPGATITVKGTKKAAGTDNNGQFSIEANPGDVLVDRKSVV